MGSAVLTKSVDAKQLACLLDEYSAPLAFYASQWSRSPEDCVQEAFVALAGQVKPPEHPVSWLFRVVRNQALNEFRSSQRRNKRERIAARPNIQVLDPANQSEFDEEQNRMLGVLKQLPPDDRELIVLRIWSGLSWSEIAGLTKTSSSSAQRRYVAALEKMKLRLEPECLTKPN